MQMQKSAAQQAAENAYWDEMAKQAMAEENAATEDLFNSEFEAHTLKLAAADPEYAQILQNELNKQAAQQQVGQKQANQQQVGLFNQAVHDELARHGYVFQPQQ